VYLPWLTAVFPVARSEPQSKQTIMKRLPPHTNISTQSLMSMSAYELKQIVDQGKHASAGTHTHRLYVMADVLLKVQRGEYVDLLGL